MQNEIIAEQTSPLGDNYIKSESIFIASLPF